MIITLNGKFKQFEKYKDININNSVETLIGYLQLRRKMWILSETVAQLKILLSSKFRMYGVYIDDDDENYKTFIEALQTSQNIINHILTNSLNIPKSISTISNSDSYDIDDIENIKGGNKSNTSITSISIFLIILAIFCLIIWLVSGLFDDDYNDYPYYNMYPYHRQSYPYHSQSSFSFY